MENELHGVGMQFEAENVLKQEQQLQKATCKEAILRR